MYTPFELSHGRIDQRSVRLLKVTPTQVNFPCIRSLAQIERSSIQKKSGEQTKGSRLFLSSQDQAPPHQVLQALRLRWNVENKNHHPRDATFLEDKCRCRSGNTTANLSLLRGAVLTLWKSTQPQMPAPAFIAKNHKQLDKIIAILTRNQRLREMQ